MLTKNELKALWKKSGFRPSKRLGQNFLIDKNVKDKILSHISVGRRDTVLEIGAGFAELTLDLAKRAKRVFAVEKDKRIASLLRRDLKLPSNVTLLEKDFLDVDIKGLAGTGMLTVYGNIPYYVTSPILEKIFKNISQIRDIYLVVQKEVVERLAAKPGSKDIARLSLFAQYYTDPKPLFRIGRNSFYPVPGVDSLLVRLEVLKGRRVSLRDEKIFFEIIKKAYGQRRKIILNSLQALGIKKETLSRLLKSADIDPFSRAEGLSIEDFARLANTICIDKH